MDYLQLKLSYLKCTTQVVYSGQPTGYLWLLAPLHQQKTVLNNFKAKGK
jgi:hypothetical protein